MGRWKARIQDEIDNTRRKSIYRHEIKECRQQYEIEATKDRQMLAFIIKNWRDLKKLRKKNKYQSTSLKLIFQCIEVSQSAPSFLSLTWNFYCKFRCGFNE